MVLPLVTVGGKVAATPTNAVITALNASNVTRIVPAISGTGGTSAVDATTGAVTFSGAITQLDFYVPTASLALLSTAKWVDVVISYLGSTVGTQTLQLLDGAGAVDATASSYTADYVGQATGVAVNDNRAATTLWASALAASRKRRYHSMRVRDLALAIPTLVTGTFQESDVGTTNRIMGTLSLSHDVNGIKAGFRLALAGMGTLSNGEVSMEAHY